MSKECVGEIEQKWQEQEAKEREIKGARMIKKKRIISNNSHTTSTVLCRSFFVPKTRKLSFFSFIQGNNYIHFHFSFNELLYSMCQTIHLAIHVAKLTDCRISERKSRIKSVYIQGVTQANCTNYGLIPWIRKYRQ